MPGLSREQLQRAGAYRAALRSRRTEPAALALEGWTERHGPALEAARREAAREAFEERAAIVQFEAGKPRAEAEAFARACLAWIPGAV